MVDRLATRAHSLCGHQQSYWKLDSEFWPNCATVRIKLQLRLNFAKCISDVIYLGICDLEYYNCIAVLSMCSKRKIEWPQSPLTVLADVKVIYLSNTSAGTWDLADQTSTWVVIDSKWLVSLCNCWRNRPVYIWLIYSICYAICVCFFSLYFIHMGTLYH